METIYVVRSTSMEVYLICDELNRFFVQWMKMINSFFAGALFNGGQISFLASAEIVALRAINQD